ncbi:SDR family NAD(P)-dependent oxidoreductase [Microbacterium sp. No. 7]|uniref:SDR family NAD(P)-dependent oxidoreductase n=1 Tax=Microbacterium sp. No. 7 TaxID=1714373 RepID=UPI0006CFFB44|nr:SDR family oxidoreductase [Microbacterium sp. No. 7]ALJ22105.1 hypothetical protein AOA12_20345 [Microbacterium sp. No. 7]
MELSLSGKRIVVTGGTSGIGRATAKLLVAEGASVLSVGRAAVIDPMPGETIVDIDLSATDADRRLGAAVDAAWGGRCDGLAAVAGVMRMTDGGVLDAADHDWRATWEVNVLGTVRALRATVPPMIAAGGGAVVLMSSVRAVMPDFRQPDYSVTKAAVRSLARMTADEFAHAGVRVNSVSPGAVRTDAWDAPGGVGDVLATRHGRDREEAIAHEMAVVRGVPLGRIGTPEEIARVVAFLLSPVSCYLTGEDIRADGGYVRTL